MKPETREKVLKVLERYARGKYVSDSLKLMKLSPGTYYKALIDPELAKVRDSADLELSDFLHEEQARDEERLLDARIDVAQVGALRERLRSRQWRMSRLDRARFGDQTKLDVGVKGLTQVRLLSYVGVDLDPESGELVLAKNVRREDLPAQVEAKLGKKVKDWQPKQKPKSDKGELIDTAFIEPVAGEAKQLPPGRLVVDI